MTRGRTWRKLLSLTALAVTSSLVLAEVVVPWVHTPEITEGSSWDDGYFTGTITLASEIDDPLFGIDATAEFTLDACATGSCPSGTDCAGEDVSWQAAQLQDGIDDEVVISGSTDAMYPDVAALEGGDAAWVVVYQTQEDDGWTLRGQLLSEDGSTLGSRFRVDGGGNGQQRQARVIGLASGGFVIVWVDEDDDDLGVYAQVFDTSGSPLSSARLVHEDTEGRQHYPTLAASEEGGFVVAWTTGWVPADGDDFSATPRGLDVIVRAFDEDGDPVGDEDDLPLVQSDQETWASATPLPGEGWLVGWKAYDHATQPPDVTDIELAARIVDVTGSTGSTVLLDEDDIDEAQHLVLAATSDAAWVAAAWEMSHDGERRIRARVFDEGLVALDSSFFVDEGGGDDALRPALGFVDDATLLVVWTQESDSGAGAVMGSVVDTETGRPIVDPFRLDDDDGSVEVVAAPRLARHADAGMLVVWSERYDDPDAESEVHIRVLRPGGILVAEDLAPEADVAAQFRWTDAAGTVRCSAVGSWNWANPEAGSEAVVAYLDGYTNHTETTVEGSFSPGPVEQLLEVELWAREAGLLAGTCAEWGEWTLIETDILPALSISRYPDLPDISCVQYRWNLMNRARISYEHGSSAVTRADRVPPSIDALALDVDGDTLTTTLTSSDVHSGIDSALLSIGESEPQGIEPNGSSMVDGLSDGPQRVEVAVYDLAGNEDLRREIVVADLAEPSVDIVSIEDGDTVGDTVPFVYLVEGDVETLMLELDSAEIPLADTLTGLSSGEHTVSLLGETSEGEVVSDVVVFTVDPDHLSVVILAPLPQAYAENDLVGAWYVSDPDATVTLSWDGGSATESAVIEDLAEGEHTLDVLAVSSDGREAIDSVTFTVEDLVPELEIESPAEGEVLASGNPQVLCWSSVDPIAWEVGGRSGTMSCGERIPNDSTTLSDGDHTLYLTATHASGNELTVAVDFKVDSQPFDLALTSPSSGVYGSGDIPLTWTTSSSATVTATLDGEDVDALRDLEDGAHTLTVRAVSEAGAEDTERVDFVVASLVIVSPEAGAEVASSELPPEIPLVYAGGEDCASLTVTVDENEPELVSTEPGETLSVPVAKGAHSLWLTCNVGSSTLSRVVDFEIGELDVAAGDGTLSYAFEDCTEDWTCTVTVTATLHNLGDFDVTSSFPVRLDHLTEDGERESEPQTADADPVAEGGSVRVSFEPVRASLEDRLSITIDPDETLAGETRENNYAEVRFLAASLNTPDWLFGDETTFLSGSSFNNGVMVSSSGPVGRLRLTVGDLVVEDRTPSSGDTWAAIADMGLLSATDDCVELAAVTEDDVVTDAKAWCPGVGSTPLATEGHAFPWYRYASGGVVDMDDLDREELAEASLKATRDSVVTNVAPMLPVITDTGEVAYLLMIMVGEPDDPLLVDMGDAPLGGGEWQVPTQTSLFSVLLSPTAGTCSAEGVILTDSDGITEAFDAKLEDAVNDLIRETFADQDLEALLEALVPGPTFAGELPLGTDNFLFAGAIPDVIGEFGLYTLGVLDLSLTTPTFELDSLVNDEVLGGFDASDLCALTLGTGILGVDLEATLWAEAFSELHLRLGPENVDYFGVGMPHWNWIPIPPLFGFASAEAELHPQDLYIPGSSRFDAKLTLNASTFDMYATAEATSHLAVQHGTAPLYSTSAVYYPVIFAGFGVGADNRADWLLDAYGFLKATGEYDFDTRKLGYPEPGGYSRFYIEMDNYNRSRGCFLFWCWVGDWNYDGTDNWCTDYGDATLEPEDPCPCGTYDSDPECYASDESIPF